MYAFARVFVPVSDGGVGESSLQKASFPSGSVDQLTQETLRQARRPLAERALCEVSHTNQPFSIAISRDLMSPRFVLSVCTLSP